MISLHLATREDTEKEKRVMCAHTKDAFTDTRNDDCCHQRLPESLNTTHF